MATPLIQTKRWTREEYERLVALGVFGPEERLQLLEGEIVRMTPQGSAHATAVSLTEEKLRGLFGAGFVIRVQMPLALDPDSEPEPDIAVVVGSPRDYRECHPSTALLVVEVSDTTLLLDQDHKARIYARAGIPEYWIVNLVESCLEVYSNPATPPHQPARYQVSRILRPSDTISPLAQPTKSVPVRDLLP
jgi:Uma2 family endonuclease